MGKYDDIINMDHHVSETHARMPAENRAAQFAPFAALSGYEDEVKETEKQTLQSIEADGEISKPDNLEK